MTNHSNCKEAEKQKRKIVEEEAKRENSSLFVNEFHMRKSLLLSLIVI